MKSIRCIPRSRRDASRRKREMIKAVRVAQARNQSREPAFSSRVCREKASKCAREIEVNVASSRVQNQRKIKYDYGKEENRKEEIRLTMTTVPLVYNRLSLRNHVVTRILLRGNKFLKLAQSTNHACRIVYQQTIVLPDYNSTILGIISSGCKIRNFHS